MVEEMADLAEIKSLKLTSADGSSKSVKLDLDLIPCQSNATICMLVSFWIGFCHTGSISLFAFFVFVCMYTACCISFL